MPSSDFQPNLNHFQLPENDPNPNAKVLTVMARPPKGIHGGSPKGPAVGPDWATLGGTTRPVPIRRIDHILG